MCGQLKRKEWGEREKGRERRQNAIKEKGEGVEKENRREERRERGEKWPEKGKKEKKDSSLKTLDVFKS